MFNITFEQETFSNIPVFKDKMSKNSSYTHNMYNFYIQKVFGISEKKRTLLSVIANNS